MQVSIGVKDLWRTPSVVVKIRQTSSSQMAVRTPSDQLGGSIRRILSTDLSWSRKAHGTSKMVLSTLTEDQNYFG